MGAAQPQQWVQQVPDLFAERVVGPVADPTREDRPVPRGHRHRAGGERGDDGPASEGLVPRLPQPGARRERPRSPGEQRPPRHPAGPHLPPAQGPDGGGYVLTDGVDDRRSPQPGRTLQTRGAETAQEPRNALATTSDTSRIDHTGG